jgi:1-deoxy-D-xylulose-5-phosphate synthase
VALAAAYKLAERGIEVGVVDARFAKPIDESLLDLLRQGKTLITLEDHSLAGGFASALMELAASKSANDPISTTIGRIVPLAGPDRFIPAAPRNAQLAGLGLSVDRVVQLVETMVSKA